MVMTRDAVLADAERLAQALVKRFVPGEQPWNHAVILWANAQPAQAKACLRHVYWRQTHGQTAGTPALSTELVAVLAAAERVWQHLPEPRVAIAS